MRVRSETLSRLVNALANHASLRPAANDSSAPVTVTSPWDFRERSLEPDQPPPAGPATEILFSRLTVGDVAEVETRLEFLPRAVWEAASPEERKRLALAFGLHYRVPGVLKRSGLIATMPPPEVHSMDLGPVETGGSYYYADMVLEHLEEGGRPLAAGARCLDFGCSSGRVVRALAGARPDVEWQGCDPNEPAIVWAGEHLPGIEFFVSETEPPLPHDAGELDLVVAISVWSHFSASGALRWLQEMHRVIRPGGQLIFTTHGRQACLFFSAQRDPTLDARLGPRWLVDTWRVLDRDGHCFWSVFDKAGDWGVFSDEWGLAFFTPEWLLAHITPRWALTKYRIGRAQGCQDLFALERR